ncbi:MAG: type II/IV secretion system protein [Candidatus Harrisonbacteria bacterium]|nr:type II/IV secretion system protein [Candidatus Harrisonbacteria bacterium]
MRQIPKQQLETILLNDGIVTAEDFAAAEKDAARLGQDIVHILISRGIMTWDYFYDLLAKFLGVARANLGATGIDEEALRLLPEDIAREKRAIVFGVDESGAALIAMEDPSDLQTSDFLQKYLARPVKLYLASQDDLNRGFSSYSARRYADFKTIISENIQASLRLKSEGGEESARELPIVSIVDTILSYAVSLRASDMHLEILENELLVRYRIDGVLHEIIRMPKEVHDAIIARIKILANLKLDEHSKPQDGRFRYKIGDDTVDVRISAMPTLYGEKIVGRMLTATQRPLSFEEIGMLPATIATIRENISKAYGMVLACGPTGSGKTTTLYAMLTVLNRQEVNIVTIEDPIEFGIPNVNQTQINPDAGITFATGLRALVRQDPNVIMVGEIRDKETAEISVHSALTGSLVLSTLHTNDAATAVPRMFDIGVAPFLVAAVVNLIIGQRLVRHICLDCIESYAPDAATQKAIAHQFAVMGIPDEYRPPKILYRGRGCEQCGHIGYRGRFGIYELLEITESVRRLIVSENFSLDALRKLARDAGMVTMFEDGLRKVERGMTTIEEVFRVVRE